MHFLINVLKFTLLLFISIIIGLLTAALFLKIGLIHQSFAPAAWSFNTMVAMGLLGKILSHREIEKKQTKRR